MNKQIDVSGLRLWFYDSEDLLISAIVNPRVDARSYSSAKAFTRGKDRDEKIRKTREEIYKAGSNE